MFSRDKVSALLFSNGFTGRNNTFLSASAFRVLRKLQYAHSKRMPFMNSSYLHSTGAMWPKDSAVTSFLVKKKVLSVEVFGRERRYRLL